MKILSIVGARPQFIKSAVVTKAIQGVSKLHEVVVHTGQHFDVGMSDVFFNELQIPEPKYRLSISGLSHGAMTGRMLEAIEKICVDEKPDYVMVYGDTNSTLAGGLAAAKLNIPVAHVEAGLRSYNRRMPEEINRVLVDHLSSKLFATSESAVSNLVNEGIAIDTIDNVGDVMFDAALQFGVMKKRPSSLPDLPGKRIVLATLHRAENVDNPSLLEKILDGLNVLANEYHLVLPLHPRTRRNVEVFGLQEKLSRLIVLEPVSYFEIAWLISESVAVVTDSGGLQKEAFYFNRPCITVRTETEWTELVEAGWNHLVRPEQAGDLGQVLDKIINTERDQRALYGGGKASVLIAKRLGEHL